MTLESFIAGFLGASPLEITAALSGFMSVFLIIKRNIWCWFFGLIQVTLYSYIFYTTRLYSDAGLHVIYIGLQFYGWWNWMHHKSADEQKPELIIQSTSLQDLIIWWTIAILSGMSLGFVMSTYTNASFAYADAFTTCTSLVAQWLLTRRHLLNWVFWMVVDIVAIYIYFQKGLYPTSALYLTFLIMCFIGQYSWWKQHQMQLEAARM